MASVLKLSRSFKILPKNGVTSKGTTAFRAASIACDLNQTLVNVPPTKITVTNSGLRVATEDWCSQTATVGIWIDAGSRYEHSANNGVANFMEHMAFKGTGKRSQCQLEIEIEDMGAQLNAYTSREQTAYYSKCLAKDVPKVVEILSDIVQNAKLGDVEIERERGVILRELEVESNNLQEVVLDHLHSAAFQGTELQNTILGPTKNIRSINACDLRSYLQDHYKPSRMVLAGAGGVSHEELVQLAEENFGCMTNEYAGAIPSCKPCRFTGCELRIREDDLPLAHVAIAVEGVGWCDSDRLILSAASTLIGEWDRSVSIENDLCHSYQSFNTSYKDIGLWGVYFVCSPREILDMMYNIQKQFMRLCTTVTECELDRARSLLATNTLLQLDTSTAVCKDIGHQLLCYGRRIPPHELMHRINAITLSKFRDVCYKYLYDRCPVVAGIGPVEDLPDYARVRSQMYLWWL